jgi:hypothetical protein
MIELSEWTGLVTNASPYVLPPGAAIIQTNLQVINPGQLVVRQGLTQFTYDAQDVDYSENTIIRMFRYQDHTGETILYQDSTGRIYSSSLIDTSFLIDQNDNYISTHERDLLVI